MIQRGGNQLDDNKNTVNVFESFFQNFIKTGILQKEFTIEENFTIKLKVLNSEETVIAETMFTANNPLLGQSGFTILRSAALIAMATVSINGVDIVDSELPPGRVPNNRYELYGYFLKMPLEVMSKIWGYYVSLEEEQGEMYNKETISDSIKNS